MRAILRRWIAESPAPVLLCPIPTFGHLQGTLVADGYRARFAELARESGATLVDLLPALQQRPAAERRAARFAHDEHPSRAGHALLAAALAPHVERALARAEAA
jgi:lysophospholipase L1-like esterase